MGWLEKSPPRLLDLSHFKVIFPVIPIFIKESQSNFNRDFLNKIWLRFLNKNWDDWKNNLRMTQVQKSGGGEICTLIKKLSYVRDPNLSTLFWLICPVFNRKIIKNHTFKNGSNRILRCANDEKRIFEVLQNIHLWLILRERSQFKHIILIVLPSIQ